VIFPVEISSTRRVYFCGHRVHHGLAGIIMLGVGIWLLADDIHDAKHWVPDLIRHHAWNDRG
jgi:hypothetical protein